MTVGLKPDLQQTYFDFFAALDFFFGAAFLWLFAAACARASTFLAFDSAFSTAFAFFAAFSSALFAAAFFFGEAFLGAACFFGAAFFEVVSVSPCCVGGLSPASAGVSG